MNRFLHGCGLILIVFTSVAMATDGPAAAPPPPDTVNNGSVHFDFGVDLQTAYFFRGVRQTTNSPIVDPYVTLNFDLIQQSDFALMPYIGTRNYFVERSTANPPMSFYESDIYMGLDFIFKPFTVQLAYNAYPSPNGSFSTIHEIELSGWWDDAAIWKNAGMPGNFSLTPRAGLFREIRDNNFTPFVRSSPHRLDTYVEASLTPTIKITPFGDKWPLTLSAPTALGFSPDHYYDLSGLGHTDWLGYLSSATRASVPLPVPPRLGVWEFHAAFNWMHDYARDAKTANNGRADLLWFSTGVGIRY